MWVYPILSMNITEIYEWRIHTLKDIMSAHKHCSFPQRASEREHMQMKAHRNYIIKTLKHLYNYHIFTRAPPASLFFLLSFFHSIHFHSVRIISFFSFIHFLSRMFEILWNSKRDFYMETWEGVKGKYFCSPVMFAKEEICEREKKQHDHKFLAFVLLSPLHFSSFH